LLKKLQQNRETSSATLEKLTSFTPTHFQKEEEVFLSVILLAVVLSHAEFNF